MTRKKSPKNGKAAKVATTVDPTTDDATASPSESDRPTLVDMGATDAFAPADALLEGRSMDVAGLQAIDSADIASVATEPTTGEVPDGGASSESASATDAEVEIEQARGLSDSHLRGLLEALVFASDKPMKSSELARLASAPVRQVRQL